MLGMEVRRLRSAYLHVVADVVAAVEGRGCAALGRDLRLHEIGVVQGLSNLASTACSMRQRLACRVAGRVDVPGRQRSLAPVAHRVLSLGLLEVHEVVVRAVEVDLGGLAGCELLRIEPDDLVEICVHGLGCV